MSEPTAGYVIKAVPNGVSRGPLWLLVPTDDSAFEFFGPRDKARVFSDEAEATDEAKRWLAMLQPALSIVVEPAQPVLNPRANLWTARMTT
jgi:hypothetical protein